MLMILALSICLYQSFIPKAHTQKFHGVSVSRGTFCQQNKTGGVNGKSDLRLQSFISDILQGKKSLWLGFYSFMYDILSLNLT